MKHRHKINEVDALRIELDILHNEQIALALKVKEISKYLETF